MCCGWRAFASSGGAVSAADKALVFPAGSALPARLSCAPRSIGVDLRSPEEEGETAASTSSSEGQVAAVGMLAGLVVVAAAVAAGGGARAEFFTAVVGMETLLDTEAALMAGVRAYIAAQEHALRALNRYYSQYDEERRKADQDVQSYLSNPINAFLLLKRLTINWHTLESLMLENVGSVVLKNITNLRSVLTFPSYEDLSGAAVALMRLQDTYKLDTTSVARGKLNGIQYSTSLSADDCFEIGRELLLNGYFSHSILWLQEALKVYEQEFEKTIQKLDILEYLAYSHYIEGNVLEALKLTNQLLEIAPDHKRALDNRNCFIDHLDSHGRSEIKQDNNSLCIPPEKILALEDIEEMHPDEKRDYEMLCRNEVTLPKEVEAKLRCHYTDLGSPFLKLARVKLEEAYLDPPIVIFHDIIYDSEIETIKSLALPMLERAGVISNNTTGETGVADYRVSKSAWLEDEEDKLVLAVSRRVEMLTGLSKETAEEMQVVNYGIGGHYEPHYDFADDTEVLTNEYPQFENGNRIATILFYLSDVEQGGGTVFPNLKVAVKPKKGSALLWYNLHRNGEGDTDTKHAACPVLVGSKWVCTKWLHTIGQEFRRPCGLDSDD